MRSRYDLAQDSSTQSPKGTYYKDIFTIPMQKFSHESPTLEATLDSNIIKRPDFFAANLYGGDAELEDIVFWLNNIGLINYSEPGDIIDAPSIADLENFYYKYRV